jgi:hypothetical protein
MFSDRLPGRRHLWPVRNVGQPSPHNPFFVLGHPRSGTTLLRAILSRHPDVFVPPENGGLWRMIRVFGDVRSRSWEEVVDRVLAEFEQGYDYATWALDTAELRDRARQIPEQQRNLAALIGFVYQVYGEQHAPGKAVWGDKTTPGSFDYLGKLSLVYPDAAYVHIIRDGRDCVASAMKAGFFNRDIALAARAWRDNVSLCRRFGVARADAGRYLELRYESLVSDPAQQLPGICRVLGITPDPAMLEHDDSIFARLPDVSVLHQHANVARPVFRGSVGKWRRGLSPQQLQTVEKIMGSELEHCGYQTGLD